MSVKVSSKYQVVIPEGVREALGIKPGLEVDVIARGGVAYIVPIKSLSQLAERLDGKLNSHDRKGVREKTDRKL